MLCCNFLFCYPSPGVFLSSPHHSSPPSSSATAAAASRAPARSILACSHYRIPTHAPGSLSEPSHRSNSDRVAIYCATVFWRRLTYSSIIKKTRCLPCRRRRGVFPRPVRCPSPGVFLSSPHHSSPPSSSATAASASRVPSRSIPTCYHHRIPTCSPGALSYPSHRSNSDRVVI